MSMVNCQLCYILAHLLAIFAALNKTSYPMANNRQKTKKEEETYADMWDLYHTLADHIATQLRRFLEATKRRYPSFPGASFRNEKEWQAALRTMIRAFDLLADCRCPELRDPHLSEEEQEALIQEGLRLFCQHFKNLWL